MRAVIIACTGSIALGLATRAEGATWCHPIDNTARILTSANPNDIHEDWRGESYLGTAWALAPRRNILADGIPYIEGDLYSPRGGLINPKIYVLRKEWSCDA